MRTVRHDGETYVLLKQSADSSLVRDPETGDETYLPTDKLEAVDEPPLDTLATAVPADVRTVLRVTHNDRALGLLLDLHENPRAVRDMLSRYELCESDLLGLLTECRAAGVVEESTVAGEPGYELTDVGETGVDFLLD